MEQAMALTSADRERRGGRRERGERETRERRRCDRNGAAAQAVARVWVVLERERETIEQKKKREKKI